MLLLFNRSVMQTLCNHMAYSMSGFPVLHYLLEFAQTYAY